MEPYDVYKYYMAMKLHFESDSYEAPKYNYKTSARPQSFFKRRDKYHFAKLGRKFDEPEELINFFTAQFTASDKTWVGDMLQDEEKYTEWQRRQQSLSYNFEQDINKLAEEADTFDELLETREGNNYPLVIEKFLQDEISLETVVILDRLTGFMRRADRTITETIVWPDLSKRIRKYGLLLRFDKNRMRQVVLRIFTL
jgi:hypothetical protein